MTANPSPPKVDLPTEQKRVIRGGLISAVVCAVVLAACAYLLPMWVSFPTDLTERLAFTLRADALLGLWVVVAVRMVSKVRFYSAEDSAGSAYSKPSPRLAVRAAFLQNTLEQAFIAIVGHLALATVNDDTALAYILGAVLLFCVGRITFWRGYPKGAGGRAFGIVTTALPTIGAYGWVGYDVARRIVS